MCVVKVEQVIKDICEIFNLVNDETLNTYEDVKETLKAISNADDEYYDELCKLKGEPNERCV